MNTENTSSEFVRQVAESAAKIVAEAFLAGIAQQTEVLIAIAQSGQRQPSRRRDNESLGIEFLATTFMQEQRIPTNVETAEHVGISEHTVKKWKRYRRERDRLRDRRY